MAPRAWTIELLFKQGPEGLCVWYSTHFIKQSQSVGYQALTLPMSFCIAELGGLYVIQFYLHAASSNQESIQYGVAHWSLIIIHQ